MLYLNLQPIFKARGINRPQYFLVKAGLSPSAAQRLLNNEPRSIQLDHIETLCRLLVCDPCDLISYTPEANKPIAANHPLNNLIDQPVDTYINETMANLPFKQLKALNKQLSQQQEEKKRGNRSWKSEMIPLH